MIKIENVTKLYGEQRALDNVSFQIQEGEIVGCSASSVPADHSGHSGMVRSSVPSSVPLFFCGSGI